MKFSDKIKLAWHNLTINKSRSILTIVIVYVLGFLIMGLLFIGIAFSKNMTSVYHQLVKENNINIYHYDI
ncbi:MAG: hypothetical protein PHX62_08270 [Bacilli bacterium]|nr:hypothetical protein [Bacilli bacterium]